MKIATMYGANPRPTKVPYEARRSYGMEQTQTSKNLHAATLSAMLLRMVSHAGGGSRAGVSEILGDMRRMTDAVSSLATISESRDPDLSPEARQKKVFLAAQKLEGVLPTVTSRLDALETETRQKFDAAFTEHSGLVSSSRAGEIRQYLREMKNAGERTLFVQEIFKSGDSESLGAILFAPSYLSGLDSSTHSTLRGQVEAQRIPEIARSREIFAELSSNLRTALGVANQAARDFSNPHKLADFEARANAVREAEAKLNQNIF